MSGLSVRLYGGGGVESDVFLPKDFHAESGQSFAPAETVQTVQTTATSRILGLRPRETAHQK